MNREKYVDESWKETAAQEKEILKKKHGPSSGQPSGNPVSREQELASYSDEEIHAGHQHEDHGPDAHEDHAHEHHAHDQHAHEPHTREPRPHPEDDAPSDVDFLNYVTSLAYQAMIFLGEIPHPATNTVEKNVEQAKFLIDTLVMLKGKTKGNLSKQENDLLNSSVYELQLKYVEVMSTQGSDAGGLEG